jgi:hypothetical protein
MKLFENAFKQKIRHHWLLEYYYCDPKLNAGDSKVAFKKHEVCNGKAKQLFEYKTASNLSGKILKKDSIVIHFPLT